MHLLMAQKGSIAEDDEAIDLGQTPASMIFISAADTELAAMAAAAASSRLSLRAANLMRLSHPMSVDTYAQRTAQYARLIIVRCLGGAGYWPYGLEALHATAHAKGIKLAILPGDDKPDPSLLQFCTIDPAHCAALHDYFIQGGAENMARVLAYSQYILGEGDAPQAASPLMKAGLWWPNRDAHSPVELPHDATRPKAALIFYRALVQSAQTAPVAAMIDALSGQGLDAVPIFVSSLKDAVSIEIVRKIFTDTQPDIVLNATGFAVSTPGAQRVPSILEEANAPILQVIFSSTARETWQANSQGLSARDLTMNIALPEVDGRIFSRAVAFKSASYFDENVEADIVSQAPDLDRCAYVAQLAGHWVQLRRKAVEERSIAIILANYPNKDGRLANGVGLDTPQGTIQVLKALNQQGYDIADIPADGTALVSELRKGVTNVGHEGRIIRERFLLNDYKSFFAGLDAQIQAEVTARWGVPEDDPLFVGGAFALGVMRLGRAIVGVQPARGYNIDPVESYHDPALVPPHNYLAFYGFLRVHCGVDAIVHMGKHGNLEWLPGKALGLTAQCYPEAIMGPVPHLYPFIVNDPGEGTQAKRRSSAVIIDHLTPPLTRAESYGPLRDLEALVDEYYEASGGDARRINVLRGKILVLLEVTGLGLDAGIDSADNSDAQLEKLDAYLCELKEMQIRDGLHVFGLAPEGRLLTDLTVALARVPRGLGEGGDNSLQRAIAHDLGLAFDPLDCDMGKAWNGPRPDILLHMTNEPWRITGDSVERIELLAAQLVDGSFAVPEDWPQTATVMAKIESQLQPSIVESGAAEIDGLLLGLNGCFVMPGPSGAPTRGRPDVLPTGRNFYSVDARSVPTETAWELGRKSAALLIERYVQDHGDWPTSFGLTAWGTSNMRTGGDDIAQALALIGVKPLWDGISRRVTGFEIIPVPKLGRPRVDVTLRISGFFRDAFPDQIALFDRAVRAVAALDEDAGDNPIALRFIEEKESLIAAGSDVDSAALRAGYRVFGSMPGSYGAGLQALIDEKGWHRREDLAEAYLTWGGYAYGAHQEGVAERDRLEVRLAGVEAVVQNQDNREHDILDSDDYYQFEGGMAASVEALSGTMPTLYHNDHSRPERPLIRTLDDEIARVVRARAANPKWIEGVMRHGYKGAFEMAATVDYLFAFSATTGAVRDHHFAALYDAYLEDATVRSFIEEHNPDALREIAQRFAEAIDRKMWTPRRNSIMFDLERLMA